MTAPLTALFIHGYDGSGLPLTVPVEIVDYAAADALVRFTAHVPPSDTYAVSVGAERPGPDPDTRWVRAKYVTHRRPDPASFNWLD